MVRKVGANTPGVSPPELYDITGDMRQRIAQDTQQASSAAQQAFGNLAQAQAANSARMLQNAETAERARFMQAQAQNENAKGGNVLNSLGNLMTGLVGGFAAGQEIEQRREQLEMSKTRQQFEMDLAEREHTRKWAAEERMQEAEMRKADLAEYKAGLERYQTAVDASVAEISAQIEQEYAQAVDVQGITFADDLFNQKAQEFEGLFNAYPELRSRFVQKQSEFKQNLMQRYGSVYREEIDKERKLQVNIMNQKASLALSTRYQELAYSAGTWSAEQAQQAVNGLISEGLALAQQDPAFSAAVRQNPVLMRDYYNNLLNSIGTSFTEYSKKNAEITQVAASIREVNAVFSQLAPEAINDPAVMAQVQEFIASKGLPQWTDPASWATSVISTAKNRKNLMDSMESTQTASQLDPMFGLDTAGHRAVANVNKAELLFNALNQRDGWDIGNATAYASSRIDEAKKKQDYTSLAYWESVHSYMTEYKDQSKNYFGMKDELRKLDKEFADMTRPQQDTTVLPDVGSATRVPVTGVQLQPKASQEEIDALNKKRLELRGQITEMRQVWLGRGIDLDNTKDDAPLKQLKNGAAPYLDQLNQSLMQRGAVPDTGERAYQITPGGSGYPPLAPPIDERQRRQGSTTNFTGGRVPTETVVQGQTGTLPLPQNAAPQTPSVPLRGGLATAPGLGTTPFKAGKVSFTGGERGQLTISSSDPRVASPIGGQVMYAGGTSTMGKTIVIRTADGLTEVYSNVNTLNVKRGDNVAPGMVIGTASRLGFQVWQNEDSVRALRMESPRNMIDPIKYLNGTVSTVQLPRGTGVLDATTAPPTVVAGGSTNMFASDKYTIFGDLLWDKTTGKTRQLTPKERSHFYPQGMHQANQTVRNRNSAQAQAQAMGLQAFGGASDIVSFGKTLQTRGWTVWQHPEFGGVGKHSTNSYHYRGLAVDVHTGGKSGLNMQQLADEVVASAEQNGVAEVIHNGMMWKPSTGWQRYTGKNQHKGHVHIAFKNAKFKAGFSNLTSTNPIMNNKPTPIATFNTGDARQTANLRAFADGIAHAEGTDGFYGYNTYFTGKKFDSSKPHPEQVINGSSAAGRYQFMPRTWRDIWGGENKPMTPANQDAAFIILLKRRGAYEDVLAGRFDKAYAKVSNEWASVKGNSYTYKGKPQGKYSPAELANFAGDKALSYFQSTQSYKAPNPPTRDQVSNRPARVAQAAPQASVYPPNKAGRNYGYTALAQKPQLASIVYNYAQDYKVPAQWMADALYAVSGGFRESIPQLPAPNGKRFGSVEDFAKHVEVPLTLLGQGANRSYVSGNGVHTAPRSNCPTCQQMERNGNFRPHTH